MTTTATVQHIGVGIDTARYGHRVKFLRDDRQTAAQPLTVTENRQGYERLQQELERLRRCHPEAQFHVHIDAAGQYAANLERFLRSLPLSLTVSIGEPKCNKDYHKAFFPKRTSDDTESHAMARFAVVERPSQTPLAPDEFVLLREIAGRLHGQIKDTTRAINRLHNLLARVFPELSSLATDLGAAWVLELLAKYPTAQRIAAARLDSLKKVPYLKPQRAEAIHQAARHSVGSLSGALVERLVQQMVAQIKQCRHNERILEALLLDAYRALPRSGHIQVVTIPGIGAATAAVLVAKIVHIERFATPEHLTGYFGVFPQEDRSGVDRQGQPVPAGTTRMSAKGCDLVRRYLWNAAKSAIVHNPAVRELYKRLRARGTRGDVALGHCMRKLLHQAFGVWTSDRPFDPQHVPSRRVRTNDDAAEEPAVEPATETAAGHNREQIPDRTVVTAAASHLEPVSVSQAGGGSIDYLFLREQISFERVLSKIGVLPALRGTAQRRGACPLCNSGPARSFSVNLRKNIYQCFQPGCSSGNVLDFWAAYQRLPLHLAARHLAETFGLPTQRHPNPSTPPPKP
jgi:transposase